jgi:hypothetical protein
VAAAIHQRGGDGDAGLLLDLGALAGGGAVDDLDEVGRRADGDLGRGAGRAGDDLDVQAGAVDAVAGGLLADHDVAGDGAHAAGRDLRGQLVEAADGQRRIEAAVQVDVAGDRAGGVGARAEQAGGVAERGADLIERGGGGDQLDVRRRVERIVGVAGEQLGAGGGVDDVQAGGAEAQRAAQDRVERVGGALGRGQRDRVEAGARLARAAHRAGDHHARRGVGARRPGGGARGAADRARGRARGRARPRLGPGGRAGRPRARGRDRVLAAGARLRRRRRGAEQHREQRDEDDRSLHARTIT